MSKKRKGTPPVTFRSGNLLPELQARGGKSTGTAASRDLGRLYDLYREALAGVPFTADERRLLTDVDVAALGAAPRLLWATVDNAIRGQSLAELHHIEDPATLVARLRSLTPLESHAVVDALERFWVARRGARSHEPAEVILDQTGLRRDG